MRNATNPGCWQFAPRLSTPHGSNFCARWHCSYIVISLAALVGIVARKPLHLSAAELVFREFKTPHSFSLPPLDRLQMPRAIFRERIRGDNIRSRSTAGWHCSRNSASGDSINPEWIRWVRRRCLAERFCNSNSVCEYMAEQVCAMSDERWRPLQPHCERTVLPLRPSKIIATTNRDARPIKCEWTHIGTYLRASQCLRIRSVCERASHCTLACSEGDARYWQWPMLWLASRHLMLAHENCGCRWR